MAVDEGLLTFVLSQRVARLATVDASGAPHVVPVCFALDGDTLYSAIDAKPKTGDVRRMARLRNVTANPRVQVLFDVYDDADWTRLRYVQLRGTARVIEGGEEHARALALLRRRYAQYQAGSPYARGLESNPVIAINVDQVVEWPAR